MYSSLFPLSLVSAVHLLPSVPLVPSSLELDPTGIHTEQEFYATLKRLGVETAGYANWFTGRWPYISFIGGMVMGNVSEHLEFFYEKPFRWWTNVLDYVMDGGGRVYGIRATIKPYREKGVFPGDRSYLLWYRCDTLLAQYHPSYIMVNGNRMWDSKIHPLLDGKILVPFSQDEPGDPIIDFVIDLDYTPGAKGLAFRMFNTLYLGAPGVKVALKGAGGRFKEGSPVDALDKFKFGVFPSGYDFWSDRGVPIADLKREWRPNFRPSYPTDNVWLSPFTQEGAAQGPYHDFMVTYGGCNVLGIGPSAGIVQQAGSYARGVLARPFATAEAKQALALGPNIEVHWFGGEDGLLVDDNTRTDFELTDRLKRETDRVGTAKRDTGAPERVKMIYEPFPPALTSAHEYERGRDILVLKNEEDPQYNILMSMGRGAGRSVGKQFGFYWEQTHYPYLSTEFKLQACLLYYLSGGSWIGAEAENAPSFADGAVAEWVLPYVKALRFAMLHPARGKPIVPIGICWGYGDRWWAPYNPLGQMDTFTKHLEYDHATHKLTSEPSITKRLPYMPEDRKEWSFENAGHLAYFVDHVKELKGYDLLDVFFPNYGDAFTARIASLLTGTPFGPLDFVYVERASSEHLSSYGLLAFLGRAEIRPEIAAKLQTAVSAGATVLVGAQHLHGTGAGKAPLGIKLNEGDPVQVHGGVFWHPDIPVQTGRPPHFSGRVYSSISSGWKPVAWVGFGEGKTPLIVRRTIGHGEVYVFLGEWIEEGRYGLRALLQVLAARAAPLYVTPENDQLEYVAYRKAGGAWIAMFNHGAIPVGCDRLKTLRAIPPEPLCSIVQGTWTGEISIHLNRIGLDAAKPWVLHEVDGIDGDAFERVISGHSGFTLRPVASQIKSGVLRAHVTVSKRAQIVISPPGRRRKGVFWGKLTAFVLSFPYPPGGADAEAAVPPDESGGEPAGCLW